MTDSPEEFREFRVQAAKWNGEVVYTSRKLSYAKAHWLQSEFYCFMAKIGFAHFMGDYVDLSIVMVTPPPPNMPHMPHMPPNEDGGQL